MNRGAFTRSAQSEEIERNSEYYALLREARYFSQQAEARIRAANALWLPPQPGDGKAA